MVLSSREYKFSIRLNTLEMCYSSCSFLYALCVYLLSKWVFPFNTLHSLSFYIRIYYNQRVEFIAVYFCIFIFQLAKCFGCVRSSRVYVYLYFREEEEKNTKQQQIEASQNKSKSHCPILANDEILYTTKEDKTNKPDLNSDVHI